MLKLYRVTNNGDRDTMFKVGVDHYFIKAGTTLPIKTTEAVVGDDQFSVALGDLTDDTYAPPDINSFIKDLTETNVNLSNILDPLLALADAGSEAFAITPSDNPADDFALPANWIWVGTGGVVVVVTKSGAEVPFAGVPNGTRLPVKAARIKATGTTAGNLVGVV